MVRPHFNLLEISDIQAQTHEGVCLSFSVPEALKPQYAFLPGQYLTLRATVDGEDIRRCYSICSAAQHGGVLDVGIKRVAGGAFSNYAHSLVRGDRLQVMTPQGQFTVNPGGTHHYQLIAAGSGITPCLSIIRSVLAAEPDSHVNLLFGNQSTSSVMFRDELGALKDKYLDRFIVNYVMSRERQDVAFLNGRIDAEKIKLLIQYNLIDPLAADGVYLCGPAGMTEAVTAVLTDIGIDPGKIHCELFLTDGATAAPDKPARIDQAGQLETGADVQIILDGVHNNIRVDAAQETVLQAAQRAGLDLPFACAGGMCCTCRCKIVQGETTMDMNYSLAQWEIDAGFTLACQSRPSTQELILDFDAL